MARCSSQVVPGFPVTALPVSPHIADSTLASCLGPHCAAGADYPFECPYRAGGPASPKSIAETSDDGSPCYLRRPLRSCLTRIRPAAAKSASPATRPTFQASEKGVTNVYSPTTTKQTTTGSARCQGVVVVVPSGRRDDRATAHPSAQQLWATDSQPEPTPN
jgi:hypothetical protein